MQELSFGREKSIYAVGRGTVHSTQLYSYSYRRVDGS